MSLPYVVLDPSMYMISVYYIRVHTLMITSVVIVYRFKGTCVVYAESSDTIPQLSAAALDLFEYTLTFNLHWH